MINGDSYSQNTPLFHMAHLQLAPIALICNSPAFERQTIFSGFQLYLYNKFLLEKTEKFNLQSGIVYFIVVENLT